ncbi:zinc-ribbon domain-containing protein [Methanolobus profundi]|uniref:Zinc-ribbon domain-containing protein n=2 Tax=Methanolobus profundi TaxID=487685 RepID=A0A1I4P8F4_9EURY|nr:zinc-ribbon domain-containing protein [Methanolobus profundi]
MQMSFKLSYLDPRNNLRIGVYIGLLFGLSSGITGMIQGGIIGLILAFITAFLVQRMMSKKIENDVIGEDVLSNAFVLGIIIAIFGAIVFSSFKAAPAIALFSCTIVAVRSGSKYKKLVKEKNLKIEDEKARLMQQEKEASDSIDVTVEVQQPLRTNAENPVKITIMNPSHLPIRNVSIRAECPRLVRCDEPEVSIDIVEPDSAAYNVIFVYPRITDMIDLGKIHVGYLLNNNYYRKIPIDIGEYGSVDGKAGSGMEVPEIESHMLQAVRETEFYQGFIRLKMSVNNTSPLVVNDVSLEFDFDEHLFRIDRFEPAYTVKNNKLMIGNIEGNTSRSVAIYFDPLLCSNSSDIKCRIFYKDAKGKLRTTEMKPKNIKVTCPIMRTDSDINVGMLRELVSALPFSDSKVYRIKSDLDTKTLMNICREMVQRRDIRHIRTLRTKDGKNYETWYHGKTKVNGHDIVLKITISKDTGSIELFGATQTAESLVGMLAEFGRELSKEMEESSIGKSELNQIVNVTIKDSIIQRSNLLNSCDISGNCAGDVVIEDSVIQRTEFKANFCPSCGTKLADDANFCSDCGTKII